MDLLSNILGGQQQQQEYSDFAKRYEKGAPWDGISDEEAYNHHAQIAANVPPDVYQRSAQDSFSRLAPDQRRELGRCIQQRAPQYGVSFPDADRDGQDDRLEDPAYLAQMTGRIHQQQPGLLGQILGGGAGGPGGGLGGALGGVLGGGGGGGGMLSNPIAKAALGGIAAMAVKQMMGGRR